MVGRADASGLAKREALKHLQLALEWLARMDDALPSMLVRRAIDVVDEASETPVVVTAR